MYSLTTERKPNGELHIVIPPELVPRLSSTGRSWVFASTEGAVDVTRLIAPRANGAPVFLEVNLYSPKGNEHESKRAKV